METDGNHRSVDDDSVNYLLLVKAAEIDGRVVTRENRGVPVA